MSDTTIFGLLSQVSDEALQRLWREGVESGDAGEVDFAALKAEARSALDRFEQ